MGQTSSAEATPVEETVDPRIKLAPELAQKIANDFKNQELQKAWRNVQESIVGKMTERDRRVAETSARLQASSRQLEAWRERISELDNSIEHSKAKFSDGKVALEYDTRNVEQVLSENQPWQKEMPCLGQRAHWIDCQKKYALDSRPCDAYVDALERCVNEVVVQKVASS